MTTFPAEPLRATTSGAATPAASGAAAAIVAALAASYAQTQRGVGSTADRASMLITGYPSWTTRQASGGGDGGLVPSQQSLLGAAIAAGTYATNGAVAYQPYDPRYPPTASGQYLGTTPPEDPATATTDPAASDPTAAAGTDPARLGWSGSGSLGGWSGGSIGDVGGVSAAAVPHASAAPGLGGVAAAAALGVAARALAGSGAAGAAMPFFPFMPFAGAAGAGGDSGSRRVPSWLVETEDVWGESAAVTPPVIGDSGTGQQPPAAPPPGMR